MNAKSKRPPLKIEFATRPATPVAPAAPPPGALSLAASAALAQVAEQDPEELRIRFPPEMKIHPFAFIYPSMTRRRFKEFVAGVRLAGKIVHPILRLPDGSTVDGRHREFAGLLLGLPVPVEVWTGEVDESLLERLRQDNLQRRDLTTIERAECADREAEALAELGRARQLAGLRRGAQPESALSGAGAAPSGGRLLAERSRANGVSLDTSKRWRWARKREPAVRELVSEGLLGSVAEAQRLARLPEALRPVAVKAIREGKKTSEVLDLLSPESAPAGPFLLGPASTDQPAPVGAESALTGNLGPASTDQPAPVGAESALTGQLEIERQLDLMLNGRQAMRPLLRRLLCERPRWTELTMAEQNKVRALSLRGLARFDMHGVCEALVPEERGPVEEDLTPTGPPRCTASNCTDPVVVMRPHLTMPGKSAWCEAHDPYGCVRTFLAQQAVRARGVLATLPLEKRSTAAQELAQGLRALAEELAGAQ